MINLVNYKDFKWKICPDLKVIALVLGLQGGFTRYCCFLCMDFVTAVDKNGQRFLCLKYIFTKLSEAKLKEGIFFGPQIHHLIKDQYFDQKLNNQELGARMSFKAVDKGLFR